MKLSALALVVSVAALAVGVVAIVSDGSNDRHRCGWLEGTIRCVSNDAPRNYQERGCVPLVRTEGLLVWANCRTP
jgi:hypothetical protein